MSTESQPLSLHAYAGKENGLMVVGTKASLRALGEALVAASQGESDHIDAFPPQVACPPTVGPYKDVPDYSLTFHIEGSAPLAKVLPFRRRNLNPILFVVVAACTIVGAVTIFQWAVKGAL